MLEKEELKVYLLNLKTLDGSNLFQNNLYLDQYCSLIESNKDRIYNNITSQSHHILPRFCFKFLQLDSKEELLVNLLYKDHILAHYYLSKFINPQYFHNAFSAVLFLIRDNNHFNKFNIDSLEDYQQLYEDYKKTYFQDVSINQKKSQSLKGLKRSESFKQRIRETHQGLKYHYSENSKKSHKEKLLGNSNRIGSHHSEESKSKISQAHLGVLKPETSLKLRGKSKSYQHKLHMSQAHIGKTFSTSIKAKMSVSQTKRDPSTRAFKYIYYYNGLSFRGEIKLLEYLKSLGYSISGSHLRTVLNNESKKYPELNFKITRERSNFKYESFSEISPENDQ